MLIHNHPLVFLKPIKGNVIIVLLLHTSHETGQQTNEKDRGYLRIANCLDNAGRSICTQAFFLAFSQREPIINQLSNLVTIRFAVRVEPGL